MALRKIETWALDRILKSDDVFREYVEGDLVFRQGDPGDFMAVVMRGSVVIRRADRDLAVIDAGSVFGEMALIDGEPRSADAVARAHTRVAIIDERHFKALVRDTPDFSLMIMKILVERLRANLES